MPRTALTVVVWAAALLGLVVGGLLAALLVAMPTALGPSELVEAGLEPWVNALWAGGAFLGLVAVAVAALAAWHSTRLRALGLVLTVAEVAAVTWAALKVYSDYF